MTGKTFAPMSVEDALNEVRSHVPSARETMPQVKFPPNAITPMMNLDTGVPGVMLECGDANDPEVGFMLEVTHELAIGLGATTPEQVVELAMDRLDACAKAVFN